MILPLKGTIKVTSGFRTKLRPDHTGTDLVSASDSRVYAVASGFARQRFDPISGYGVNLYVGINKKFEYLHLNNAGRASGFVKEGAVLGNYKPGSGKVTGPHLHFALQIPFLGPQIDAWKYVNYRLRRYKYVQKNESVEHIAKRAGYTDYASVSRQNFIAKLNGYKDWHAFNTGVKRFQRVRVA